MTIKFCYNCRNESKFTTITENGKEVEEHCDTCGVFAWHNETELKQRYEHEITTSRDPVRVNTRISAVANDWLDKKSQEMSVSKSALINTAIENFRTQVETVDALPAILKKLEEMGIDIKDVASGR